MLQRIFVEHPRAVGETYCEHAQQAFSFGATMILAGLACFVHGLVPCLFTKTASRQVEKLHDKMVLNRRNIAAVRETDVAHGQ